MLSDPPRTTMLCTLFVYPKIIIFFIAIAFSGPPTLFLPCYAHVAVVTNRFAATNELDANRVPCVPIVCGLNVPHYF